MAGNLYRPPARERRPFSSIPPARAFLPPISEDGRYRAPAPAPGPSRISIRKPLSRTAFPQKKNEFPNKPKVYVFNQTLAKHQPFDFLAYPSDWEPFKVAFREKCDELNIKDYILEQAPMPREPVTVMIPYSVKHQLDARFSFSTMAEYDEQLEANLSDCAGGVKKNTVKLEKMNLAISGQTYTEFIEAKEACDDLRKWLMACVSKPIKERCIPGIEKGLKGQDARDWFFNLGKFMDFWCQQVKWRKEYLSHWSKLLEWGNVDTRRGLLRWVKDLALTIKEGRTYQVMEVMDLMAVFKGHLAGYGVIKVAYDKTMDGAQHFMSDVTSEILTDTLDWESALKNLCSPLEDSVIIGKGEEKITLTSKELSTEAQQELYTMKGNLVELNLLDSARGYEGSPVKYTHLIPAMEVVPKEDDEARKKRRQTVVRAKRKSTWLEQLPALNAKMSEMDALAEKKSVTVRVEEVKSRDNSAEEVKDVQKPLPAVTVDSIEADVSESEYGDMPKIERQNIPEPERRGIRDRVKGWAQSLKPKKSRLRSIFAM